MSILDLFRKKTEQEISPDEKVIDLSDNTQYPASVLTDLNHVFALGDDNSNMLHFLQYTWTKPKFHWGWDNITHEEAVKDNFLQRAFYALDEQHRERRDAMIASEGYKFVWKNKDIEPVPGLMSGDELCNYLTKSREWGLNSMKELNEREERNARRWHLNPTYEDLMADMEKSDNDKDYHCRDMGCGMLCFTSESLGNKQEFIVNTALKKAYAILTPDGQIVGFTENDIDWDNVSQLDNNAYAYRLQANYYFGIEDYQEGVARVNWMLYPDGRYFADEHGFGMEDNDETNVSAFIDTECRVLVKFQSIEDPGRGKELQLEALRILRSREN